MLKWDDLHLGAASNGKRDVLGESLTAETVLLTADEALVARLKEVGRGKERVVSVESVHERQVVLVEVHELSQVRENGVDLISKLGVSQQTGLARQSLDGHAVEDVIQRLELLGELDDGVHAGKETTGSGNHEGRDGHVIRTRVVQDCEGGSSKRTHCGYV